MKIITLILCLCIAQKALAQDTIVRYIFPDTATIAYIATAKNANNNTVRLTPKGGNQRWIYKNLSPQTIDTQRFVKPNTEGVSLFPLGNLTFPADSNKAIPFYRKTDTLMTLIGSKGYSFQGYFIRIPLYLNTPIQDRRAPVRMGDTHTHNAGFRSAFPSTLAPDSLLRTSPFLVPDSVQITSDGVRFDTLDAWGILELPDGNYPVVRERRKENIKAKIEIKYGNKAWQDVTTFILAGLTEPFRNQRFYTYFWSNNMPQPLMVIESDSLNNILSVQYKYNPKTVGVAESIVEKIDFNIYPNPVSDMLQIDIPKEKQEDTYLQIINMQGQYVYFQNITHKKNISIVANHWAQGVYFAFILDKQGRLIGERTFVKQ
jgi:hypothetical protein